jgi:hypothetical protein
MLRFEAVIPSQGVMVGKCRKADFPVGLELFGNGALQPVAR